MPQEPGSEPHTSIPYWIPLPAEWIFRCCFHDMRWFCRASVVNFALDFSVDFLSVVKGTSLKEIQTKNSHKNPWQDPRSQNENSSRQMFCRRAVLTFRTGLKFLDPWVHNFYPVLGWGLAPSQGECDFYQYQHWIETSLALECQESPMRVHTFAIEDKTITFLTFTPDELF